MKKIVTLFVLVAFVFTVQLSVQPLQAADSQPGIQTQPPSVVEQEGETSSSSGKKSILPIILGVVAAGAIAAVLVLVVFKTKYDITGEWLYSWKLEGDVIWRAMGQSVLFSGDKKSGTLTYHSKTPGTYSVDGSSVTFDFNYSSDPLDGVSHTGKFDSKDKVSGTWVAKWDPSLKGYFEMVRKSSTGASVVKESKPAGKL